MLAATAIGLLSTVAAMTAPSSVNANGSFRRPPHRELDVANCDIKILNSGGVRRNMKPAGNRSLFRLICSLSHVVETPYRAAKSLSRMRSPWPSHRHPGHPPGSFAVDQRG